MADTTTTAVSPLRRRMIDDMTLSPVSTNGTDLRL